MADYGLRVSLEDQDAFEATGQELLLSTAFPFAKLDATNDVSFQNTLLTFLTDPPEPSVGTELTTTIHSFAHGYTYVPSAWHLVTIVTPKSGTSFDQEYFQDSGVIAQNTAFDGVTFLVEVDATTVYYKITKFLDTGSGGSANNIVGVQLRIRSFIFVEGVV